MRFFFFWKSFGDFICKLGIYYEINKFIRTFLTEWKNYLFTIYDWNAVKEKYKQKQTGHNSQFVLLLIQFNLSCERVIFSTVSQILHQTNFPISIYWHWEVGMHYAITLFSQWVIRVKQSKMKQSKTKQKWNETSVMVYKYTNLKVLMHNLNLPVVNRFLRKMLFACGETIFIFF